VSTPLVVVGTSLGGLDALTRVLAELPEDAPAAIAVVQHRRPDSDTRLADLLERRCRLRVAEPQDKEPIASSRVYVAPADYHLLVDGDCFALDTGEAVSFARPSIDVLFESAADASTRPLVGVLLTAASEDGARGIAAVARAGGVTIVQDPEEARSGVAPRAAIAMTRVDYVLRLEEIGPQLLRSLGELTKVRRWRSNAST